MVQIHELNNKEEMNALLVFLEETAPEQTQFVAGDYFKHGKNHAFGVFDNNTLIGAIRYCKQIIGEEQYCPPVIIDNATLYEAKINVFAVSKSFRSQGIGTALQKHVINHAKANDCYQLSSYSTYDKSENYQVKLKLGFCVQPEKQADGMMGCYFLMRL